MGRHTCGRSQAGVKYLANIQAHWHGWMSGLLPYIQTFLLAMIVVGMAVNSFTVEAAGNTFADAMIAFFLLLALWVVLTAIVIGVAYLPYYLLNGGWEEIQSKLA